MDQRRLKLNEVFLGICPNVYFQPPNGTKLSYPCIIYQRDDMDEEHANNLLYRHHTRYSVTVMDTNPDSTLPGKIAELPMCSFNRFYTADNLNHDVYILYF